MTCLEWFCFAVGVIMAVVPAVCLFVAWCLCKAAGKPEPKPPGVGE